MRLYARLFRAPTCRLVLDPSILWKDMRREESPRITKQRQGQHSHHTHITYTTPQHHTGNNMQPQQAPLADDEKLLLMLYSSLKRAITPLHETAGPGALNPSSLSPQIIPLLNFVILDDKGHDEALLLTQNQPLHQARPLMSAPAPPASSTDVHALASHLNEEMHLAMQTNMPLGARAYEISQAASHLRSALMKLTGVEERGVDKSTGAQGQQQAVAAAKGAQGPVSRAQKKRAKKRKNQTAGKEVGRGEEEEEEDEQYHKHEKAEPSPPVNFKVVVAVLFAFYILVTQGPLNVVLLFVAYFLMSAVVNALLKAMS